MTLGYSSKCKACNSTFRAEIDKRLIAGETTREVAKWLSGQGETVSHVALASHRLEHCNVTETAKAVIAQTKPCFDKAVHKVVADATLLDEVASVAMTVVRNLSVGIDAADMPQVVLFNAMLKEVRGAVKTKHEMLHGKKVNVDGQLSGLADLMGIAFEPAAGGDEPPPKVGE